jgi:hypothetical protein
MAREIREIPLTTERLLAEHDLVATVADRIRHANPRSRVVVISEALKNQIAAIDERLNRIAKALQD